MNYRLIALTIATALAAPAMADEMSFPDYTTADVPGAPKLGKPFLVMGETKPVWAGKHGLAAPALWDWDGDGKRDLLVGEFETTVPEKGIVAEKGSSIRVYLNVGTDEKPAFTDEWIWARDTAGTVMEVPQWCCIGFTPQFVDLNDDGHLDIITGQYHPGEVTWFRGTGEGFKPGVHVPQEGDPSAGVNSFRYDEYDGEPGDIGTFHYWVYSSANMADLDDDGDYDLVFGGSAGLRWSENIGSRRSPSYAERQLLLDVNGEPLKTRDRTPDELKYEEHSGDAYPAGDGKTNPTVADWDNDGVPDLLVTDSYRAPGSQAVTFFRGVRSDDGVQSFEPGIDLFSTADGKKALPGSGNRVYVDDWNKDGVNDLILGASVATVNDGEFSDELSWEWEDVTKVESAGKDPGLYPPMEKPTYESLRDQPWMKDKNEEEIRKFAESQQDFWYERVGRHYDEGTEHWLTMRHQGRIYVFLGEAPEGTSTAAGSAKKAPAAATAQAAPKAKTKRQPPVTPTFDQPAAVKAGETAAVTVNFDMLPQWYIYAPTGRATKEGFIETTVKFDLPEGFETDGAIDIPPYEYKGQFHVYYGQGVKWVQNLSTSSDLAPGEYEIKGAVRYQTCKNDVCLPPRTETITTLVMVN